MLSYYKISKTFGKTKGNFLNSVIINTAFLIFMIPSLYFYENPILSRYWFFILFVYLPYNIFETLSFNKKLICYISQRLILRASGGIGIRAGLRNQCRKA